MKLTLTFHIPEGIYCKGCQFLHDIYVEHEFKKSEYRCQIFKTQLGTWEEDYFMIKKCEECLNKQEREC
jgi:hypothetical protein